MSGIDWDANRRNARGDERAQKARAESFDKAKEAAKALQQEMQRYAATEEKTAQIVREATKAQDELTRSRQKAARQAASVRRSNGNSMPSASGTSSPTWDSGGSGDGSPIHINFNLGSGRNYSGGDNPIAQIARMRPGGGSGGGPRFSFPNMRMPSSGGAAAAGAADAGAGAGAAEAVGGAEALGAIGGPEGAAIAFVIGEMVKQGVAFGKQLYDLSGELSRTTVAFTDLRAQVGGTTADAARATALQRITGVDAGSAARSLNQHITSDPFAMSIAAKYGVYNIPGPYGRRDYGKMYNDLVERVATNPNEDSRQREAEALGISQEVRRYYLLSDRTRENLRSDTKLGAKLHDEDAERRAAELSASFERAGAATDNLKSAMGELFGEKLTEALDTYTAVANAFAEKIHDFNTFLVRMGLKKDNAKDGRTQAVTPPPGTTTMPWMMDPTNSGGNSGASGGAPTSAHVAALEANTMATQQLTAAMGEMSRVFGGGERQRASVPSSLHGLSLIRAYEFGAVGEGTL